MGLENMYKKRKKKEKSHRNRKKNKDSVTEKTSIKKNKLRAGRKVMKLSTKTQRNWFGVKIKKKESLSAATSSYRLISKRQISTFFFSISYLNLSLSNLSNQNISSLRHSTISSLFFFAEPL